MDANTHEPFTDSSDRDDLDPEAVQNEIRTRGEEIKRRELQRAFNRLESNGELTSEQREIIRQMATAIVDGLLAAPESALEDCQQCEYEAVQTAVKLCDPDQ